MGNGLKRIFNSVLEKFSSFFDPLFWGSGAPWVKMVGAPRLPMGSNLFMCHHEVIFLAVCELLAKISDFLGKFDDRVKTKMAADRSF